MSLIRTKLYEEHKNASENCDIIFGFCVRPDQKGMDDAEMDTDEPPLKQSRITVHTHKQILIEASTVFETLLTNQWNQNIVEFSELSPAQFIKFLEILYLDKVEDVNLIEEGFTLYGFAGKYNCERVILLLTNYMIGLVFDTKDTNLFYRVFELTTLYVNPLLEESCLEFASKYTQKIIESDDFLHAHYSLIEKIYKLDIMDIENELSLVKALENYISEHEKLGHANVKEQLKPAIYSIRFHILEKEQIINTILLSDEEKSIFVSIFEDGSNLHEIPINFTRKCRNRYDSRFIKYSPAEIFRMITEFLRCHAPQCKSKICPTFLYNADDLSNLKPEYEDKYHQTTRTLQALFEEYINNKDPDIVEKIFDKLFELDECFDENDKEGSDNISSDSSSSDALLISQSSEEI